jgi:hypothetical protein
MEADQRPKGKANPSVQHLHGEQMDLFSLFVENMALVHALTSVGGNHASNPGTQLAQL